MTTALETMADNIATAAASLAATLDDITAREREQHTAAMATLGGGEG